MLFQAQAREARSGPRLTAHTSSTLGIGFAWKGCIEAMTPSLAKRGMSAALTASMCSIRWRRPRVGGRFKDAARS
jgi:hypothetical protein